MTPVQKYLAQATEDAVILAAVLQGKATFYKGPQHLFFIELFVDRQRFVLELNDAGVPLVCDAFHSAAEACRRALAQ